MYAQELSRIEFSRGNVDDDGLKSLENLHQERVALVKTEAQAEKNGIFFARILRTLLLRVSKYLKVG